MRSRTYGHYIDIKISSLYSISKQKTTQNIIHIHIIFHRRFPDLLAKCPSIHRDKINLKIKNFHVTFTQIHSAQKKIKLQIRFNNW